MKFTNSIGKWIFKYDEKDIPAFEWQTNINLGNFKMGNFQMACKIY